MSGDLNQELELREDLQTPPVLLGYQQELLASTALSVVVVEKSRRIGISWASASEAVTVSARTREAGGMDTLYIGYNLDMAKEFIGDCAFWAQHLAAFTGEVGKIEETVFDDGKDTGGNTRSIKAYRISFASGYEIMALTSRPRSLRGRQGFVIIDEAAFHDDLAGLLKAAMALLIWGGKVWVVSTHEGADNTFNELVEDCRAGKKDYKLLRMTFQDAIDAGLYKRICLVTGKTWTSEAEANWIAGMYNFYGDDAAEELDVIPSQGDGVWLTRALIKACMKPQHQVMRLACEPGFELKPDYERQAHVEAWLEDNVGPWLDQLDPAALSYLGGDFARTNDLSVLSIGQIKRNTETLGIPFIVELRNVPFREQEQVINYIADRLPNFTAAAFDANGIGASLAEFAMQRYGAGRVAQVKATQEWYRDFMTSLKARFEDRTIECPLDDDTINDLRSVKVNKGVPSVPKGVRMRSSRGGWRHGDGAVSIAMLHSATERDWQPPAGESVEDENEAYRPQGMPGRPARMFGARPGGGMFERRT